MTNISVYKTATINFNKLLIVFFIQKHINKRVNVELAMIEHRKKRYTWIWAIEANLRTRGHVLAEMREASDLRVVSADNNCTAFVRVKILRCDELR